MVYVFSDSDLIRPPKQGSLEGLFRLLEREGR